MTKKPKAHEQLPRFVSWEHYDSMTPEALTQLCEQWQQQLDTVRSEMSHKEIIVGRSNRYKAYLQSRGTLQNIQQFMVDKQQRS